jgi:hypothetical protein
LKGSWVAVPATRPQNSTARSRSKGRRAKGTHTPPEMESDASIQLAVAAKLAELEGKTAGAAGPLEALGTSGGEVWPAGRRLRLAAWRCGGRIVWPRPTFEPRLPLAGGATALDHCLRPPTPATPFAAACERCFARCWPFMACLRFRAREFCSVQGRQSGVVEVGVVRCPHLAPRPRARSHCLHVSLSLRGYRVLADTQRGQGVHGLPSRCVDLARPSRL